MATNRTLTMLKPDTVENGNIGNILKLITDAGFKIVAMKMTRMKKTDAERFYEVHKERPFYSELVSFMTSGPIVAAILEKTNAVEDFRRLIGATNPEEADTGTVRKLYASSTTSNAIHGSDSNNNAKIESDFHFDKQEQF